MIEEQLRDGLRAAVTQEPPLGFDPDELADTARRTVHRRRTAWATAAVAVIVAAGAIGAVATFGRAGGPGVEPAHRGGGMTEVSATDTAAFELGESLTRAVREVEPSAKNFDVRLAGGHDGGVVLYDVDEQRGALTFVVSNCRDRLCTHDPRHVDERLFVDRQLDMMTAKVVHRQVSRRTEHGLALVLASADNMERLDHHSDVGPWFDADNPCNCPPGPLKMLSRHQMDVLIRANDLALFDPRLGERVLTLEELKHREELEHKQAELEAEVARTKREAEEAARKSGGK